MSDTYLAFVGTRPECIKTLPLIVAARNAGLNILLCDCAQHKDLNKPIFEFFSIFPDFKFNLNRRSGTIVELSSILMGEINELLGAVNPKGAIVHGDTTTSFIAAYTCFLNKVQVYHVEAGLRTFNKYSPFPEEMNRRLTGSLADLHFAPTQLAKDNLLAEGISENQIFVVGNTAMDAIKFAEKMVKSSFVKSPLKRVLVTIHRRENHGENLIIICNELVGISSRHSDVEFIVSLHPNPDIQKVMIEYLGTSSNIKLKQALPYGDFVRTMHTSSIIITDSGGIQEEVTLLGIPTLVIREYTERPEAVEYGPCVLITNIIEELSLELDRLITDDSYYKERSRSSTVFGDGSSSAEIISIISNFK